MILSLTIRAAVPIGLRLPLAIEGVTSNIRPPNPADNPMIVDFDRPFPKPTFFRFLYIR